MRRAALALFAASSAHAADRNFQAEGVDTGAGIGPRWVAQAGAGVAAADDLYSIYTNPAGLLGVQGLEVSISRQLNAKLHAYNFIGAAWRLPLPEHWGFKATVAGSFYPRIHARASGVYTDADFESLFLRFLLPGVSGNFDGDIDSKTKTWRYAVALAPSAGPWSVGVYVDRIDCKSNFCGVHAESNGYTVQSTGAKAYAYGVGLRYQFSPDLTLGVQASDLSTKLDIHTVTTDAAGTRESTTQAHFPRKLAAGLAWRWTGATTVTGDFESTHGSYGSTQIDLQVLRFGAEHRTGDWAWRVGALVPLRIHSSDSGRLKLPAPVAPTAGLGWQSGPLRIDIAVYAHAVMSMHKDKLSPAADLSLTAAF
ncbi:hypothetical protein [Roseateles sp. P5_E7]